MNPGPDPSDVLAALEELEAERINLGLYSARVKAVDVADRLGPETDPVAVLETLRQFTQSGEAIQWRPGCFRSRIGETVRLLRLLRQRFWKGDHTEHPLLIEDVRVEFRRRRRPFRGAVKMVDALPPNLPPGLREAFVQAVGFPTVSAFQSRAIREVFDCAQAGNRDGQSFVISGDTGAGKTEAFLFPILLDIAAESPEVRRQPGVRAVLVYPRIRLALNQLGRLLRYTDALHRAGGPLLTVGIQNSEVPSNRERLPAHWQRQPGGRRRVPLLETCVRCGRGGYLLNEADPALETGPVPLTCDACGHSLTNLFLTQAALQTNCPDLLIITDVSLHQWLARERYAHLWGLWRGEMRTLPPRFLVLDEIHLHEQVRGAHIARLIKRFESRVSLAYRGHQEQRQLVVIGVSATLHDEKRFLAKVLDVDPRSPAYERLCVIKPAPQELEPTQGRERYLFLYPRRVSPTPRNPEYRVNDVTAAIQILMALMHNLRPAAVRQWRGVAFFDSINDLRQFRHDFDGRLPLPNSLELPPANQGQLWRIRTERQAVLNNRPVRVPNRCGQTCSQRCADATLAGCEHFTAGDCWVPARVHGCDRQLVVADAVYAGSSAELDGVDLVPTSPVLEVGYDDDAIQLVYQHKGPPGVASFIQRRGRAGRNPDDSPIIATLLWPYRSDDAFFFYRPEALYEPTFDDVPLNAANFQVQRTHALLALFDLIACLRRQDSTLANDPLVPDFTAAGHHRFPILPQVVTTARWEPDPKRPGERRIRYRVHDETRDRFFAGGGLNLADLDQQLRVNGMPAMENGLLRGVLLPAWQRLQQNDVFNNYLGLAGVLTEAFRQHSSYPFRIDDPAGVLTRFGLANEHDIPEKGERANWVSSFRGLNWNLMNEDAASTLTVHFRVVRPDGTEESEDRTVPVTFGVTELVPGNVSFRLRQRDAIHWTPVPRDGESTFLYPQANGADIPEYLPTPDDLASRAESILGVPRFLDDRFPGLPLLRPTRIRVATFGPPDRAISPTWFYVPGQERTVQVPAGESPPPGALRVSRRSSTGISSVIVPHVPAGRRVQQRTLAAPLDQLFGAVRGYVEEGAALLGYTRVFYEMQHRLQLHDQDGRRQDPVVLRRLFYPPHPSCDESGRPRPVLVGHDVHSHGIAFEVNQQLLDRVVKRGLADEELRLSLRRRFTLYSLAAHPTCRQLFAQTVLADGAVVLDYWLHEVVPAGEGEPRLLDPLRDVSPLTAYLQQHRLLRSAEVESFRQRVGDSFLAAMNDVLPVAYRDTEEFRRFVQSVLLHSLATLLKRLVGRLGGVGGDELVAYADLPLLQRVDPGATPRILIIDTVEGGAGGVAQAFERLDLTDSEGSLWSLLRAELGQCPVAAGESLLRTVLCRLSVEEIRALQQQATPEALTRLLEDLDLRPLPAAVPVLGRALFSEMDLSRRTVNAALVRWELERLRGRLQEQAGSPYPCEATARRAVLQSSAELPEVEQLRQGLVEEGSASAELEHELGLQLRALHEQVCADGCPVCMSGGSDVETPALAPLLTSRRLLLLLREELERGLQTGTCLAEVADLLRPGTVASVSGVPGRLAEPGTLPGLSISPSADAGGQVVGGSVAALDELAAREFFARGDSWSERWGGRDHRNVLANDGTWVRSRAEALIANWLHQQKIPYEYEVPLPYNDEHGRRRYIHPDFHLFEQNVYVEYWGRDDKEYIESRVFKEGVYRQRSLVPLAIEKHEVDDGTYQQKIRQRLGIG